MRLRRKPWIDEAIKEYNEFLHLDDCQMYKGKWHTLFKSPEAPLWVELGTGKGNFISQLAQLHRDVNFIGIEIQAGSSIMPARSVPMPKSIMCSSCAVMSPDWKIFLSPVKSTASSSISAIPGLKSAMPSGV